MIRNILKKRLCDSAAGVWLPTILVCFFFQSTFAQNNPGAHIAAMGGTALVNEDVWSAFHNQAGLVHCEGITAGAFYEDRFAISQLSDKGVAAAMPIGNSAFALSYRSFGYSAFSSSRAALAYALKLSSKFSAGLQLNYHTTRIGEGYGNSSAVSFEGGFLYRYNDMLSLAAHVYNPTRAKLASFNDERIPSVIRAGAGYKFSDRVKLNAEVKLPSAGATSVHTGIEYRVMQQVAIRAGVNTLNTFSFGFGWLTQSLQIDASAGYHQVLGFTPQLSLTYKATGK
ncbi:MAG: hypothetical protein ACKVOR_04490 [Flavobacteriales bacterium]